MAKIGSPLFILREECQKDLMSVLEKLAEIGYEGVEFLGYWGYKLADVKSKLDSCGLIAIGNHVGFNEFTQNIDKTIADNKNMGCKYITIGGPEPDGLPGGGDYSKTLDCYAKVGEAMNAANMTLLYHNHAAELKNFHAGKSILENLMDDVKPGLLSLEPDCGWIQIGGGDPFYYLDKYANRCPVVHFKDFIPDPKAENGFLFRPTGYGIVNYAELYKKTLSFDKKPEWYILDHDCAYERDIYFDMKISLEYFKNLMTVSQ